MEVVETEEDSQSQTGADLSSDRGESEPHEDGQAEDWEAPVSPLEHGSDGWRHVQVESEINDLESELLGPSESLYHGDDDSEVVSVRTWHIAPEGRKCSEAAPESELESAASEDEPEHRWEAWGEGEGYSVGRDDGTHEAR